MNIASGWSSFSTWSAYHFISSDPELLELAKEMGAKEVLHRSDFWLADDVDLNDVDFDEIEKEIR